MSSFNQVIATLKAPESGGIPTDYLAYYPFTGNADDSSVNAYNGTVNGASLTTDKDGNSNQAYDFDGVNDEIQLPSGLTSDVSGSQNRTFTMWVYRDSGGAPDCLFSYGGTGTGERFELRLTTGNALRVEITGEGYDTSLTVPNTTWAFVAITLNGSNLSGCEIYLDASSESCSGSVTINTGTANDILIGNSSISAREWRGKIDEFRVYDYALTSDEIEAVRQGYL